MARVSTYLNFTGRTEEAFNFYKSVFGGEFTSFQRMGEIPTMPDMPPLSDKEKNFVMHVALPILGGHILMGTDALESMGQVNHGNGMSINLEPDIREEADRLFKALAEGGKVETPLMEMFWGGYFGNLIDKFGVQWMINCEKKA